MYHPRGHSCRRRIHWDPGSIGVGSEGTQIKKSKSDEQLGVVVDRSSAG